jgi:hypothetical protein
MLRQVDMLCSTLVSVDPAVIAKHCGGDWNGAVIQLEYWGRSIAVPWPDLTPYYLADQVPCSVFDRAIVIYYLYTADGAPFADRWIGFRELPGGAFYSQAYQGYSGDSLARTYQDAPALFRTAARTLGGVWIEGLSAQAFAFSPLPNVRLAALFWAGDEEFPARAAVLFDASASHYMPTDGLALLGAGLTRRIEKARRLVEQIPNDETGTDLASS